jgi:GntR family transcriptional regulator / MocR family aminotransferase
VAIKPFSLKDLDFRELGPPRYEQLSQWIAQAIRNGDLRPGDRLPPVRQVAQDLGISVSTVTAAFDLLTESRLIRAEVGRGTFVAPPRDEGTWRHDGVKVERPDLDAALAAGGARMFSRRHGSSPWRRRSLMTIGARLRALHPRSLDCSTGRPDVNLLPLAVLQRALHVAAKQSTARDLQYAGPEVIDALTGPLAVLLEADGVAAAAQDLLIGSSAQQWMMLSLEVSAEWAGVNRPVVAVEEPGYPTIMDALGRAGAMLVPVAVDEEGVTPDSLDAAGRAGATMALVTPRAHNPTGASWSTRRLADLANVVAAHPGLLVVEDDPFADVSITRPGSLLADERIADRIIYIRSFSKSIAPDLRIALAAARPRLRALLAEAKSFGDGWTSRLVQRTLAVALADGELTALLATARDAYCDRRTRAAEALNRRLVEHGGRTWTGADGLNLWVHLPPGLDAADVVERAAAAGVRVAPGEPFFTRPGHSDVVRLNAGSVPADQAAEAGRLLAEAALSSSSRGHGLIHV